MSQRTLVAILSYCGAEALGPCLDSVLTQKHPSGGFRVLVVDNASTDGSAELVRDRYPEVELLACRENLGYGGDNNLAIRRASEVGAEYVVLLNMDTSVASDGLFEFRRRRRGDPRAAILGARIYDRDGVLLEFDGSQFDPVLTAGGYADRPAEDDCSGEPVPAAYACGAALLLRLSALQEIGTFDESFFLYHEDVELLPARLEAWVRGAQRAAGARLPPSQPRGGKRRRFPRAQESGAHPGRAYRTARRGCAIARD